MYVAPFSPRAADSCIISLVLPSLGGREDPVWLPTVHRWERGGGRRKEGREREERAKDWPRVTHLVTNRCSLAGDLGRKWKNLLH